MKVIKAFPPNYPQILRAFPYVKGRTGVVFAYGDRIYSPTKGHLPAWVVEHELVHGRQQGDRVAEWWTMYCVDPDFRMSQEIPAHIREWEVYRQTVVGYGAQEQYLSLLADRLSGPLYNHGMTREQALTILRREVVGQ